MLRTKIFSSIKWNSANVIILLLSNVIQTFIFANYLSLSEFGLLAIILSINSILQSYCDFGITNAIISEKKINIKLLNTFLWFNVMIAIFFYLLILILSPFITHFFSQRNLSNILPFFCLSLIVNSFGHVFRFLLQRKLKFDLLTKFEFYSKFISTIVCILLAINGFGIQSYIYMHLSYTFLISFLLFRWGYKKYKIFFYFDITIIKTHIFNGFGITTSNVLKNISEQLDIFLIGKLMSIETLGIYSFSKSLIMKPQYIVNPIINHVTFPVFSKLQSDAYILKQYFLKSVNYLFSLNILIYISIIILADPYIVNIFGMKWSESILLIKILSIYGIFRTINTPSVGLVLSTGKSTKLVHWNLIQLTVIFLLIIYFHSFGLEAIGYSFVISQIFLTILNWSLIIKKQIQVNFYEYIKVLSKPFSVLIICLSFVINSNFISISDTKLDIFILFILLYFLCNYFFNKAFIFNVAQIFKQSTN